MGVQPGLEKQVVTVHLAVPFLYSTKQASFTPGHVGTYTQDAVNTGEHLAHSFEEGDGGCRVFQLLVVLGW